MIAAARRDEKRRLRGQVGVVVAEREALRVQLWAARRHARDLADTIERLNRTVEAQHEKIAELQGRCRIYHQDWVDEAPEQAAAG